MTESRTWPFACGKRSATVGQSSQGPYLVLFAEAPGRATAAAVDLAVELAKTIEGTEPEAAGAAVEAVEAAEAEAAAAALGSFIVGSQAV